MALRRCTFSPKSLAEINPCIQMKSARKPRIARRVLAGVIGVEIDEAALDQPVANLEHVAPAPRAPRGHIGAPRAVAMFAVARALADDKIGAGEHPVEIRVVVRDRLQCGADVAEQLADLLPAGGDAPFREIDLRVAREQIEDRTAVRCGAAVVERLQIFECHRLALLVGHCLSCQCHLSFLLVAVFDLAIARLRPWTHLRRALLRASPEPPNPSKQKISPKLHGSRCAHIDFARAVRPLSERLGPADQAISFSVPPVGTFFAASLLTITRSYLFLVPLTHWPRTKGVLLTFFIGPPPPHLIAPTTVLRLLAATASRTSGAATLLLRRSASAATSNNACAKPIGCVHCRLAPAS